MYNKKHPTQWEGCFFKMIRSAAHRFRTSCNEVPNNKKSFRSGKLRVFFDHNKGHPLWMPFYNSFSNDI